MGAEAGNAFVGMSAAWATTVAPIAATATLRRSTFFIVSLRGSPTFRLRDSSTVDRFWLSLAGHMNAKSLREGPMWVSIWHLITVRLRGIYSCPKNFCIVQRQTQIRFCGGLMAGTQMTSDVWEAITIECEGKL